MAIMTSVSGLSNQTGDEAITQLELEAVTELELKDVSIDINMNISHIELHISSDHLHTVFGCIVLKLQKRSDIELK